MARHQQANFYQVSSSLTVSPSTIRGRCWVKRSWSLWGGWVWVLFACSEPSRTSQSPAWLWPEWVAPYSRVREARQRRGWLVLCLHWCKEAVVKDSSPPHASPPGLLRKRHFAQTQSPRRQTPQKTGSRNGQPGSRHPSCSLVWNTKRGRAQNQCHS